MGVSKMTLDEEDRIIRAEEIQRYTENRCEYLEKENARLREQIVYQSDAIRLQLETNNDLIKQNEDLQINVYSNLCEQRKIIHKNLIEAFSEQLGILDKEDDELFSLKEIKSIISNILEIEK